MGLSNLCLLMHELRLHACHVLIALHHLCIVVYRAVPLLAIFLQPLHCNLCCAQCLQHGREVLNSRAQNFKLDGANTGFLSALCNLLHTLKFSAACQNREDWAQKGQGEDCIRPTWL